MLVDPNHIWLGAEAASDTATVSYADAALTPHDDTDAIDPATFDAHWSWTADFAGGSLTLTDDETSTDLLTFSHNSSIGILEDVSFDGTMDGVNIADEIVRLSAFTNGATNVTARATETDVDEIFEFDRAGSSDYRMYLHTGGNRVEVLSEDHDVLREGDNPYPAIHNNGTEVHPGPATFDFGSDITANDMGNNTVLVEYTGGTVPGRVHDDSTEVLTDANGLDFLDYLDVSVDPNNNFAQITFNDTTVGVLANNETVTGDWTFEAGLTATAGSSITATGEHLAYHEADTATNDYWLTEADAGSFNIEFYDADTGSSVRTLTTNENGRVAAPNGPLYEQGNRVATQPWVDTELDPYADTTTTETIRAAWTYQSNVTLTADNSLRLGGGNWQAWHSTSNNDLYVDWAGGATPTTLMRLGPNAAQFPQGVTIEGNTAATQSWVGANYASPSTAETITAQWSFDQQIQGEAASAAVATDANNLGGIGASSYGVLSQAETVSGGWTFTGGTTHSGQTTFENTVELLYDPDGDGNSGGLEAGVTGNRVHIAPYDYTSTAYNGTREITFDPDGAAEWNIEGAPQAGGETIATQPWVDSQITESNLTADTQETITAQWTFDVAPVLAGIDATLDGGVWAELNAGNSDATLWHVGNGADYGFSLQYLGSGSGNANALQLWTDNQTATEDLLALEVTQDGYADFTQQLSEAGNRVATRTWTNSNFTHYTDADAQSALTGYDLTLNTLGVQTNNASDTADIRLNANANIASDNSIHFLLGNGGNFAFGGGATSRDGTQTEYLTIDSTSVNAKTTTLREQGNRVATRAWVDGANIDIAGDAGSVDGYDIYVQSTAPSTSDPYIRFEPQ